MNLSKAESKPDKSLLSKLLEVRAKIAGRRPRFLRQDYHFRLKVQDDVWRAPKGRHSKMRRKEKGKRAIVQIGYRGPKLVRGLHKSGATFVQINSIKDLEKVDPKSNICILSRTLSKLSKYKILKLAQEKGIKFANVDVEKFLKEFKIRQSEKKGEKTANVSETASETTSKSSIGGNK
ncbi:MAG: eL32 family ribosomal protein [Candidatus Nanoarchaeia archaeon]